MRAVVCVIALKEERYIQEFISYHLHLGFDHVYVYDNSQEGLLGKELKLQHVTVRHMPGQAMQFQAYTDCLKKEHPDTWIANIDTDEFIVLKKHDNIHAYLKDVGKEGGAISLNWYLFGSSGEQEYRDEPVIKRFTKRCKDVNRHVKSIVYAGDTLEVSHPHYPTRLKDGKCQHDASGNKIPSGPFNLQGKADVAVIHHYFTKSIGEFKEKIARGRADCLSRRTLQEFYPNDCNDVEDLSAQVCMSKSADLDGAFQELKIADLEDSPTVFAKKLEVSKRVIVMLGAGASTSCGIPDFRTPKTGLYDNLQKYDLPRATAVFELEYFKTNPKPFFMLAKELYPSNFQPSLTHRFVKLLDDKGKLLRCYTQNIDGLELKAGLPAEKLVQAHGGFGSENDNCIDCGHPQPAAETKRAIFADEIPRCSKCSGLVKPNITFFGQELDQRYHELSKLDFPDADLLIVMGTSLSVTPFCFLVNRVQPSVPRVLVNLEKVGVPLIKGIEPGFDFEKNRDVFCQMSTDSGVASVCRILDWKLQ